MGSEAKICCMCGEPVFVGESFKLSEEEMAVLGPTGQRELHYCSSCLKASRSLESGVNIQVGMFERMLRAAGSSGARQAAEKFRNLLMDAITRKQP